MKIEDAIKDYCKTLFSSFGSKIILTDEEGYWNVDVHFVNNDGDEDEAEFDIKPSNFDYGWGKCDKLVKLWKEFCKDNGFRQNSVQSISLTNLRR